MLNVELWFRQSSYKVETSIRPDYTPQPNEYCICGKPRCEHEKGYGECLTNFNCFKFQFDYTDPRNTRNDA